MECTWHASEAYMRLNSEMSEWFEVKSEAGLPHVTMGLLTSQIC